MIRSVPPPVAQRSNRLLVAAAGERAVVSVQNPIILGSSSAPEPDPCLLAPRADDYTEEEAYRDVSALDTAILVSPERLTGTAIDLSGLF